MATKMIALRRLYHPRIDGRDYVAGETMMIDDPKDVRRLERRRLAQLSEETAAEPVAAPAKTGRTNKRAVAATAKTELFAGGGQGTYNRRDMRSED